MDHSYSEMNYNPNSEDQDSYLEDISMPVSVTETENDATLVQLVRGYPHIYAKHSKDYKNQLMRERSWQEIASNMNWSVEYCQRRWIILREKFSKERRLRVVESMSGSRSTQRREFPLFENMMFLSEHVKTRKTYTNLQLTHQQQPHQQHNSKQSPITSVDTSESTLPLRSQFHSNSRDTPLFSPLPSDSCNTLSPLITCISPVTAPPSIASTSPVIAPPPITCISSASPSSSSSKEFIRNNTFSEEQIAIKKRLQNEEQTSNNAFSRWTKKKRFTDPMEASYIKLSSEISSFLTKESEKVSSNANDDSFGKWLASELAKMPEMERKQKKQEITKIIFS